MKGFALGLALKQRRNATRKSSIVGSGQGWVRQISWLMDWRFQRWVSEWVRWHSSSVAHNNIKLTEYWTTSELLSLPRCCGRLKDASVPKVALLTEDKVCLAKDIFILLVAILAASWPSIMPFSMALVSLFIAPITFIVTFLDPCRKGSRRNKYNSINTLCSS